MEEFLDSYQSLGSRWRCMVRVSIPGRSKVFFSSAALSGRPWTTRSPLCVWYRHLSTGGKAAATWNWTLTTI